MEKFFNNYMKNLNSCDLETGYFPGPLITISRQSGCSARGIAIKLSKILTGYSYMSDTKTPAKWKWVDKNIFDEVVEDMIKEVKEGKFEDAEEAEKRLKEVANSFSDETLYDISEKSLIETFKGIICRLACQGRTIIVGRSAGVILKNIPNKLNVRLEAPLEWRINRIMQLKDMTQAEAVAYVNEIDRKRDSFIEKIAGRKAQNDDFDVIFNYASLQDDEIIDAIIPILKSKTIISSHELC